MGKTLPSATMPCDSSRGIVSPANSVLSGSGQHRQFHVASLLIFATWILIAAMSTRRFCVDARQSVPDWNNRMTDL
jgi:hypothetical protein